MKKVLVIGSGISGLTCAIKCAELGMQVNLVSSRPAEQAQSVMAAGGINAALRKDDSIARHIEDTLNAGCHIEDEDEVKGLCESAPEIIKWLESIGTIFSRDDSGKLMQRPFGAQSIPRTNYCGTCTGKQIVSALVAKCREYEAKGLIKRTTGLYFNRALIKDGLCFGAVFYDEYRQVMQPIPADMTVVATGGLNGLFGNAVTGSVLNDSFATAKLFTQGVKLRNLEFIQYHPTAIDVQGKKVLISEAARGEGGRLYYEANGERIYFLEKAFGPDGNLAPRDVVSHYIHSAPSQVYLDMTRIRKKIVHERLQEVYDICKDRLNIDITEKSVPVNPAVHFFMGGIDVDNRHRTNILHLYAIGEAASKYHGANRLGGNSLLAALYSAGLAAKDIGTMPDVDYMMPDFSDELALANEELQKITLPGNVIHENRTYATLSIIMSECMGIERNKLQLEHGLMKVKTLLSYPSYKQKALMALAKACIMSAYEREESRGAHFRSDFPKANEYYQSYSMAEYKDGNIEIKYPKGHF